MKTPRGPYAKGVAKKAEILEVALETISRSGYSRATVKELADAVGLSQNGLLHYFGSKDALFTEIIKRRGEIEAEQALPAGPALTSEAFGGSFVDVVRHNAEIPGFIQLYSRLSNEAVESGHSSHDYFRDRYEYLREATADSLRQLQDTGELSADHDPEVLAVLLSALSDGLQTQWLYNDSIDMPKHMIYLLQLIGIYSANH